MRTLANFQASLAALGEAGLDAEAAFASVPPSNLCLLLQAWKEALQAELAQTNSDLAAAGCGQGPADPDPPG